MGLNLKMKTYILSSMMTKVDRKHSKSLGIGAIVGFWSETLREICFIEIEIATMISPVVTR